MERKEKHIDGCLLVAQEVSSRGPVLICGLCSNRSDMVGDLAKSCRNASNPS